MILMAPNIIRSIPCQSSFPKNAPSSTASMSVYVYVCARNTWFGEVEIHQKGVYMDDGRVVGIGQKAGTASAY